MNLNDIYFGDIQIHRKEIASHGIGYVVNTDIFKVLTFTSRGLRYTDKSSPKVLWI